MRRAWVVALVAACSSSSKPEKAATPQDGVATPAPTDAAPGPVTLPPAPPLPPVPLGLPAADLDATVTPENVALGALLFEDVRLGRDGKGACVTCHAPDHGWSGREAHSQTLGGKPNLRRAPALVNLAWVQEFGWDGRFASITDAIRAHWKGQLDIDPPVAIAALAGDATYRAHFARAAKAEPSADAAITALAAFVRTRYEGGAPWDEAERGGGKLADAEAGYKLFTGKAQCSTCHVPPLYTDHAYHAVGVGQTQDEGRGRVDPGLAGAFRTPTVRGAADRGPFFHDGSAATLAAAIDGHLEAALTAEEKRQLLVFVEALSR
jgi:cytochrome c peroxidase